MNKKGLIGFDTDRRVYNVLIWFQQITTCDSSGMIGKMAIRIVQARVWISSVLCSWIKKLFGALTRFVVVNLSLLGIYKSLKPDLKFSGVPLDNLQIAVGRYITSSRSLAVTMKNYCTKNLCKVFVPLISKRVNSDLTLPDHLSFKCSSSMWMLQFGKLH